MTAADGLFWPKISIITPSFNQGRFIEEAIRSVLLQGYPNLEYIIIDGGSTDGSVDIIKKYSRWIKYWDSKSDSGQSHAINRGLLKSTGDIVAWLNSDDVYCKDVYKFVAEKMWNKRNIKKLAIYGNCSVIDEKSRTLSIIVGKPCKHIDILKFWNGKFSIPQPSLFVVGKLFRKLLLDETLHYVLDWELLIRLSKFTELSYYNFCFAKFRHHASSKSIKNWKKFLFERIKVLRKHFKNKNKLYLFYIEIMFFQWSVKYFYHSRVRKIVKKILNLILKDKNYKSIKRLKRTYLPFFSKTSIFEKVKN